MSNNNVDFSNLDFGDIFGTNTGTSQVTIGEEKTTEKPNIKVLENTPSQALEICS